MPVLPEEVAEKSFHRRLWRGYDRSQVQKFQRQVAGDYATAIERIAQVAAQTPEAVKRARRDADADAEVIRARAAQAASVIIKQAEDAAAALTRHAQTLRAAAQADADTARERLVGADLRAQQLEDSARQRWEALRVETERRFDRLRAAEHAFAERTRNAHDALAALRDRVALLDQIDHVEQQLAGQPSLAQPSSDPGTGGPNGSGEDAAATVPATDAGR